MDRKVLVLAMDQDESCNDEFHHQERIRGIVQVCIDAEHEYAAGYE